MSINKKTFLILGCDIKDCKTDKFEDWYWSEEGEKWQYYISEGNVQIINDGMNGKYMYLGYIIAMIEDDYSNYKKDIDDEYFGMYALKTMQLIKYLCDIEVLDEDKCQKLCTKEILFNHFS